jgi:8-oxo-dGTP pyrophosphatase MutT (NUDIX family)
MSDIKVDAVALVFDASGRLLMVERKKQPGMWGAPGGKVEPNEHPDDAAVRELYEETGVIVDRLDLADLGHHDDNGRTVYVFQVRDPIDHERAQRQTGEGALRWAPLADLFTPSTCPFAMPLRRALPELYQRSVLENAKAYASEFGSFVTRAVSVCGLESTMRIMVDCAALCARRSGISKEQWDRWTLLGWNSAHDQAAIYEAERGKK